MSNVETERSTLYQQLHKRVTIKIRNEDRVARMGRFIKSSIFDCLPSDEQDRIECHASMEQQLLDATNKQISTLLEKISIHDRATEYISGQLAELDSKAS